ncbi:hypothetical protein AAEQ20_001567 [Staphylococcus pseudintermedius]
MKHLTKVFVIIALLIFVIGIILQFLGEETSAIKLFIATILFMIVPLLAVIMIGKSNVKQLKALNLMKCNVKKFKILNITS